jgi:hypothetical protein
MRWLTENPSTTRDAKFEVLQHINESLLDSPLELGWGPASMAYGTVLETER